MCLRLRVFREAILLSFGDLTSTPETVTKIIDQWELIDTPYVECFLIRRSGLLVTIEIDIR